jgi:hypothetical protein
MTTKTPNPTIELTLTSGATITSNEYSCAGTMVDELNIPLSTLASSRIVKPEPSREYDVQAAHIDALEAEVESLRGDAERYKCLRDSAKDQWRNGPGLYWYLPRWESTGTPGTRLDVALDRQIAVNQQEPQK